MWSSKTTYNTEMTQVCWVCFMPVVIAEVGPTCLFRNIPIINRSTLVYSPPQGQPMTEILEDAAGSTPTSLC